MIKAVRGTRDLLPPETALWNFVETAVRDVFRAYNFQEIRTPIFESTELFARGVGEETDIVSKEMFTWEDGAKAADYAVYKKWNTERFSESRALAGIDPEAAQPLSPQPAMIREIDGKENFIVFRYRFTLSDYRLLKLAGEQSTPTASKYQLRLVTADEVPEAFQLLLRKDGVIIETVEIENTPQFLTLRPENTAGVVRAYIEHKMWDRGLQKLFYIGPQFRRERPQKGRYRQFYQIGAEVIGPTSSGSQRPLRDAEVLEMLDTLLRRLGIGDVTLHLNSVGDPQDRAAYNEALRRALQPVIATMCTDCQRRAVTNPLRVFDCKVPDDQPIIQTLPVISDYLGSESKEHFDNVQMFLRKAKVPFELDRRLVRGLDYYTRTAFEFTHGGLGAQNAILGGGRYDGLAELLGSKEAAPGIGFAMGEDRLILALRGRAAEVQAAPDVYIAPVGAGMNRAALVLAKELRGQKLAVELGDRSYRLGKLLERASKAGARYALILREGSPDALEYVLKNLATGEQVSVPRAQLAQKIQE